MTVTDENGTIFEMTEKSAEMFKDDGGYAILGRNSITCHPARTQDKVRQIYESQSPNIYSSRPRAKSN